MLLTDDFDDDQSNTMDTLEFIVSQNEWPYERLGNEEIVAAITGEWCDFHMRYYWMEEKNILQCAGQLDIRISKKHRTDIFEVINLINDCLDMGYFSLWSDDNTVMFRLSIIPSGNRSDIADACDIVTKTIIAEINRYFPVFQFVIWGGKSPKDAFEATMLETVGNA